MKKVLFVFFGAIITIILAISCSKSNVKTKKSEQYKDDEISLYTDSDFQRFITLSYNWVSKLKDSDVDTATIRRLILQNKFDSLEILSGISIDSANVWTDEANTLLKSLANKYGISQHDTGEEQCSCNTIDKITKFNIILSKFRANNDTTNIDNVTAILRNIDGKVPPHDDCYYLPYIACLTVCTSTGPVLYWVCAYGCFCSYCYGPTHDKLCNFNIFGGGNTK
ncbi:MAG: hypothetical protein Q8867_06390 [Bacteroidota bacterium]|nr:hypothetical protein [Bacteroidota bacterium]